jgi:hypothetical protein
MDIIRRLYYQSKHPIDETPDPRETTDVILRDRAGVDHGLKG